MLSRTRFRNAFSSAPRMLLLAFALAIAIGGLLLATPWANADAAWHVGADRLFVAASAVCVTGLDPIGVGTALSRFGLAVLALLVQLGGIGIMTVGTFLFLSFGRALSVDEERSVSYEIGSAADHTTRKVIVATLLFSLAWELAGALLFYRLFRGGAAPLPAGRAAAHAAFFAVMSFCNAGFSLFPDSFAPFAHRPAVVLVSTALAAAGGLGFLVHANLLALRPWRRNRLARGRLSLHARVALEAMAATCALAFLVFLLSGWHGPLAALRPGEKFSAALFQTFSARASGFAIVPTCALPAPALFFAAGLMFLGAAPGSTGGGVKTTCFMVLAATVVAMFSSRETPEMHGRSVPRAVVNNAVAGFLLGLGIVLLVAFGLLLAEAGGAARPAALVFEAVSAFGNNGLEIEGTTAGLSPAGMLLCTLAMYAGRVGPASFVLVLFHPHRADLSKRYPEENLLVSP